MKAMLGVFGGILFAGAALLFINLAMASSLQFLRGYDWIVFLGLCLVGFAIAMTAPTVPKAAQRLLIGTGALVCGCALLIAVIGTAPLATGAVGLAGGASIAMLLLIGLALLAGGLWTGRSGG